MGNAFIGNSGGGASCFGNVLVVSNNTFTGNSGGGAFSGNTSVLLNNNTFTGNTGGGSGSGAGCNGNILFASNNTFTSNSGGYAGGLVCGDYGTCTISGNVFTGNSGSQPAGGAYCYSVSSSATTTISGNTFTANYGGWSGGGFGWASYGDTISVFGNTFTGNSASWGFGALGGGASFANWWSPATVGTVIVSNNIFTGNSANGQGGAIYASGQTNVLVGNLIVNNSQTGASAQGGGVWVDATSTLYMINNTIFGNTAAGSGGGAAFQAGRACSMSITTSSGATQPTGVVGTCGWAAQDQQNCLSSMTWTACMACGTSRMNNIDLAPQFFDPVSGDYHFQSTSPCLNAGTTARRPCL